MEELDDDCGTLLIIVEEVAEDVGMLLVREIDDVADEGCWFENKSKSFLINWPFPGSGPLLTAVLQHTNICSTGHQGKPGCWGRINAHN